ncbi:hypothetical protein D9619_007515 [Psilocybe cf. subviscida]|uniref:Uncharacterized protein n=1 Tax=Psilocybe cf. subviscida TaxID=2480587 RepID=A0A8H5B188_9AGAR|nr:hypothetical protein D9619_007515 [Psilocybe cf. subviscida]
MPHKKAKRSTRERLRKEQGNEQTPGSYSIHNEPIPKSAARILNSITIRDDFKKRKNSEDHGERPGKRQKADAAEGKAAKKTDKKKPALTIQPGESIQHFNRRVEDDLRPLVKAAAQTSRAHERNTAKTEYEDRKAEKKAKQEQGKAKDVPEKTPAPEKTPPPPAPVDKFAGHQKEFATLKSTAPRRLNDIAQAPPELKKLPRGAGSAIGKRDGVLSMAQKVMMEQAREKAIVRYRELKASRRQAGDVGDKLEGEV